MHGGVPGTMPVPTVHWPGKHYGYRVWVPGLVFGVAFAAAAWAKVVGTGPSWILNGSVKYHFITDSVNAPVDWGLQLAGHPQIAVLASLGAVVAEALVITAALSRNEWYRLGTGRPRVLGLLAGFWLFMGVFWPGWWILLLGFVPWSRLTTWFRRPSSEPVVGARPRITQRSTHRGTAIRWATGGDRVRCLPAARCLIDPDRTSADVHVLPDVLLDVRQP